eukprot:GHVS01057539.1.p1 GENE.GHVS01057539.1~~GHVS01057539.1.p1  ORF type:complete len:502 (+),score=45.65 GHVS01057539.1:166-1671(+)
MAGGSVKTPPSFASHVPENLREALFLSLKEHSPSLFPFPFYPYGTAGFRAGADGLRHVIHRCGMLCVLNAIGTADVKCRTKAAAGRSLGSVYPFVGAIITASHNPVEDNGVKLIDRRGHLLDSQWEGYASQMINAGMDSGHSKDECAHAALEEFAKISADLKIKWADVDFQKVSIAVGRDTRPSSPGLCSVFSAAVKAFDATVVDLGVLTTPQFHFLVEAANREHLQASELSENLYFQHFDLRLATYMNCLEKFSGTLPKTELRPVEDVVHVDGANGVGGLKIAGFAKSLEYHCGLQLMVHNTGETGVLNMNCGAEHVQKNRQVPESVGPADIKGQHPRCCSFDGDADRLVYFTWKMAKGPDSLCIIDGDRIAALYFVTILHLLNRCCCSIPTTTEIPASINERPLRVGVVQTAYANGSSTRFLMKLVDRVCKEGQYAPCQGRVKNEVVCVKTGVKYVHAKAASYDIGIFFEANGHGSVHTNLEAVSSWATSCGIADVWAF